LFTFVIPYFIPYYCWELDISHYYSFNIAYVVHVVSSFINSLIIIHWATVLHILQYLHSIIFQSLLLPSTFSLELRAYSDTDHNSNPIFANLLLVSVSFWVILLFFVRVRNNLLILNLQPKYNIKLWHLLQKTLFGYVGYQYIWEFLFLMPLLCIVTTIVLFKLLTTWFFMNELSTLRSIVILLVIISSMTPLLCPLFLLLVDCIFLYHVAFYFPFLFSKWQTLDVCSYRIVSLRGDVKKYMVILYYYLLRVEKSFHFLLSFLYLAYI